MAKIKEIKTKFCGKECTVYAVNDDNANTGLTTAYKCPYCSEVHIYNVKYPKKEIETDRYAIAIYDILCASCKKECEILDIFDKLEE